MKCRPRIAVYLLLLCNATLPFSYGLDFLREGYKEGFTLLDHEEVEYERPITRYRRNAQFDSYAKRNDNHKPVLNCSNYAPSVEEEKEPGAYVFTVHATDEDLNDNITYRFQQQPGVGNKDFVIDSTTGIITTQRSFDRDDARLRQMYVTVIATDNGIPSLFDVCTFKITIKDVNDNLPLFDKSVYSEAIPLDHPVDKEVMRIYATDSDDGENSKILYSLDKTNQYSSYFTIDEMTGIITLKKSLLPNFHVNQELKIRAFAKDCGIPELKADIELIINIVDSNKKPPTLISVQPSATIFLYENFTDYEIAIATLEAESNMPNNPAVQFVLIKGRTESTNLSPTFLLETKNNKTAEIKIKKQLDYEEITDYTLTIRITNDDSLSVVTKVIIKVLDVNDNIPEFLDLTTENEVSGSVYENEPPGTTVMQVQATDKDGTSPNNIVKYELADHVDLFSIDENTGEIRTKVEFDREKERVYNVKVKAKDSVPSSLYKGSGPNVAEQVFRIQIDDKNDNPPKFKQSVYVVDKVDESSDTNKMVIEVRADDPDSDAVIQYEIIDGNDNDAFYIDKTGKIKVKSKLDYEKKKDYELKIIAHDGKFNDTAIVKISIRNENDELPVFHFDEFARNVTIPEETLVQGCLITVVATDPDKEPNEPQEIVYSVTFNTEPFLAIDDNGCVTLTRQLDRDRPHGEKRKQALINAKDENGIGQSQTFEFSVNLTDINDNAPILNITEVVWYENTEELFLPITRLIAEDYDENPNGPPFIFAIAQVASEEIRNKFLIRDDALYARVTFDREEQKDYMVPISITDSGEPPMTGTSYLKVIIGDRNDNVMKPGQSRIFVNSRSNMPDTNIGRIYVEDLDDWDLHDKDFKWDDMQHEYFDLKRDTGDLIMIRGTQPGTYELNFIVTETSEEIQEHSVKALVTVVVKHLPDEAIAKSGSFRLTGISAEEFIQPLGNQINDKSMKDKTQVQLARLVNVSLENLDIVTVLHSNVHKDNNLLDIRYSAHGSPYRYPEELNTLLELNTTHQTHLDFINSLYMVNVAECLIESVCPEFSCTNYLNISDDPYVVNTNKTSFVGVSAIVQPKCACNYKDNNDFYCLNGGQLLENTHCHCEPGFEGPHCESLSISFTGNGYAMYPPFETCNDSLLTLDIVTTQEEGIIFYVGPLKRNRRLLVRDFMSLELKDGYPVLLMDYGSGTARVEQNTKRINDGDRHIISISFNTKNIQLNVDNCPSSDCLGRGYSDVPGPNKALNVNGPLQLGGSVVDLNLLAAEMSWNHTPSGTRFIGCISNLTYNGETYNLGQPRYGRHYTKDCNNVGAMAAAKFGIDNNFLVALFVCVAILLILLLAVVVHRKKHDNWNEKELDDIRETIINYEDEGGGEVDTGFDLELLRRENQYDDSQIKKHNDLYYGHEPEEVPDINSFLKDKKDACDRDPDFNPCDDVRYYAYEGDGNTSRSSLSSLASCTDEGDLKFNYLSNFGPRFRKLADMYGEEPSDDDDQDGAEESWC